jgi:hypothetical protein
MLSWGFVLLPWSNQIASYAVRERAEYSAGSCEKGSVFLYYGPVGTYLSVGVL